LLDVSTVAAAYWTLSVALTVTAVVVENQAAATVLGQAPTPVVADGSEHATVALLPAELTRTSCTVMPVSSTWGLP
jgi:hypothetical protein